MKEYILTLSCPDRTGIVHAVSGWLLGHQGNIIDSQQFGDDETHRFFLRVHFSLPQAKEVDVLQASFQDVQQRFDMDAEIHDSERRSRVLLLVSRQGHCLNDLLFRTHTGQLPIDIVGVASNHRDFEGMARAYGLPFHYLPVTPDTRREQEGRILELVEKENVDLVVLARYMQILSDDLCRKLEGRAINIHHSF